MCVQIEKTGYVWYPYDKFSEIWILIYLVSI